ncbi:MAG TPA: transcriptional regulator [Gemmatimonadaceae bacterium]|nr:transcriptional regulator [Gemmatimonadaceae bacterium]
MAKKLAAAAEAHSGAPGRGGRGTSGGDKSLQPRGTRRREGYAATLASLDRLIHERVRLGIVSALAVNESLTFNELKSLVRATDGNISVHARKLEEAGYVACVKSFDGRVPRTVYRLTAEGRRALERYLEHMESIIRVTRERQP